MALHDDHDNHRIGDSPAQHDRLEHEVRKLRKWVWGGNGDGVGAAERLRNVEGAVDQMTETMQDLIQAERERTVREKVMRRERRAFYIGVSGTILAIGIAGVQFAAWLSERVELLLRAVGMMSTPPF